MDILIFDMDGVLIDVSKSYRKAIQRTIQIYLETCLGFEKKRGGWVTNEEISLFKSAGGFNSDWDVTSGFLLYLLSISGIPPLQKRKRFSSPQEIILYLKAKFSVAQRKTPKVNPVRNSSGALDPAAEQRGIISNGVNKGHLLSFLEKVTLSGGGLRGIRQMLGNFWEGWVYRTGDLGQENLVERIFQEIYLGRQFDIHYHLPRLFYKGEGLYLQEKLLIPRKILSILGKKMLMGIASGRLRFEAELALKKFHLLQYFNSVVTLDECEEEEKRIFRLTGKKIQCSKPHPYSILSVAKEIDVSNPRCAYVGDVVDDILAAQAAKKELDITAIGFLATPANRKVMKKAFLRVGADLTIKNPKQLLQLID